ncbi:hypothetical protein F5Y18DRAFT_373514 [Xylariaceae sp. FL1019]|nr:hypothetical protein F5Y18DRAFT_373514 [Xylariaceae sp. FL1019]
MTNYTSTKEGFQQSMLESLLGPPEKAEEYGRLNATDNFYHIFNGERSDFNGWVKGIAEWRGKVSDYKPVVDQFLRQDDSLAAHMIGTIKVDGVATTFESFMFGKVENETGKLEWLIERSIWGATGQVPEHGVD